MSDTADSSPSIEFRILKVMKRVLTDVIKDTSTPPGMKHPLSDNTIENIRECLKLISARERELSEAAGEPMTQRPRYIDEPQTTHVVSIENIKRPKKDDSI